MHRATTRTGETPAGTNARSSTIVTCAIAFRAVPRIGHPTRDNRHPYPGDPDDRSCVGVDALSPVLLSMKLDRESHRGPTSHPSHRTTAAIAVCATDYWPCRSVQNTTRRSAQCSPVAPRSTRMVYSLSAIDLDRMTHAVQAMTGTGAVCAGKVLRLHYDSIHRKRPRDDPNPR